MSFLSIYNNLTKTKKHNGYVPLQVQRLENKHTFIIDIDRIGERAYFFTPAKAQGGITLEAAIALPIFLMFVLSITYLMVIFYIDLNIQKAIDHAALTSGKTQYLLERSKSIASNKFEILEKEDFKLIKDITGNIITAEYLKEKILDEVGKDFLNTTFIINGSGGISLLGTKINKEKESLDIVVNYKYKIPLLPGSMNEIKVTLKSSNHLWLGKSLVSDTENKVIVYMTPNGTVYHTNKNCTHIKLNIMTTTKTEIEYKRNVYGAKYNKCKICCKGGYSGILLYITSDGDSYHYSNGCSGLKRSIIEVELDKVKGIRQCQRCKAYGN